MIQLQIAVEDTDHLVGIEEFRQGYESLLDYGGYLVSCLCRLTNVVCVVDEQFGKVAGCELFYEFLKMSLELLEKMVITKLFQSEVIYDFEQSVVLLWF